MELLSLIYSFLLLLSAIPSTSALPSRRSDTTKVGYLGFYWTTSNASVHFSLTSNSNPLGFQALNNGNPIINPTLGTKAVRDVSIIAPAGTNTDTYYILGTDLNIDDTTWDASTRNGSRGIFVWQSTDLINWTDERLPVVENETAGMVWAPDAIWDSDKGQYLVHWASKFYSEDDPAHTGDAVTTEIIRYAHTSDFKTFTTPSTYINLETATAIDLSFLQVDENTFLRFYVNGNVSGPVGEISTDGLFGTWTATSGTIEGRTNYEAPYPYWDNVDNGTAYLVCDQVSSTAGWHGWKSTDPTSGSFTTEDTDLTYMRHGSVLSVTQEQYDALQAL